MAKGAVAVAQVAVGSRLGRRARRATDRSESPLAGAPAHSAERHGDPFQASIGDMGRCTGEEEENQACRGTFCSDRSPSPRPSTSPSRNRAHRSLSLLPALRETLGDESPIASPATEGSKRVVLAQVREQHHHYHYHQQQQLGKVLADVILAGCCGQGNAAATAAAVTASAAASSDTLQSPHTPDGDDVASLPPWQGAVPRSLPDLAPHRRVSGNGGRICSEAGCGSSSSSSSGSVGSRANAYQRVFQRSRSSNSNSSAVSGLSSFADGYGGSPSTSPFSLVESTCSSSCRCSFDEASTLDQESPGQLHHDAESQLRELEQEQQQQQASAEPHSSRVIESSPEESLLGKGKSGSSVSNSDSSRRGRSKSPLQILRLFGSPLRAMYRRKASEREGEAAESRFWQETLRTASLGGTRAPDAEQDLWKTDSGTSKSGALACVKYLNAKLAHAADGDDEGQRDDHSEPCASQGWKAGREREDNGADQPVQVVVEVEQQAHATARFMSLREELLAYDAGGDGAFRGCVKKESTDASACPPSTDSGTLPLGEGADVRPGVSYQQSAVSQAVTLHPAEEAAVFQRQTGCLSSGFAGSRSRTIQSYPRPAGADLLVFTAADLKTATGGWGKEKVVGKGCFGTVYWARLADGRFAAVKRLQHGSKQGIREYATELAVLGDVSEHPHMVRLIGHCPDEQCMCLVYEFLSGGSLHDYLLADCAPAVDVVADCGQRSKGGDRQGDGCGLERRPRLAWADRFRILTETASALLYLHQHDPPIVHRDVKPENILLDANLTTKVADVGLAKLIACDSDATTKRVTGTIGYIDPEMLDNFEVCPENDVYAFGLVVLQVLMGESRVGALHKIMAEGVGVPAAVQEAQGSFGEVHARVMRRVKCLEKDIDALPPQALRPLEELVDLSLRCASRHKEMRPAVGSHMILLLEEIESLC